ncbi:MerR family transcriptional regulator [Caldimonas brevitalea]|uniref:MerR family transcriptional regulator n=1 Tax=Caldimonas brevitalea TaxID=413882 RepID=A0A0G3BR85_9BURK|nr:MerR family transcriptional regulator [Caldimonas brevitalea]AKJ30503.1 MerR family transcriptional regulator [Caldimonas brevitalea]
MSKTNTEGTSYTIAAVERDVGLSKDVLRVWERRYGFPTPARDGKGERLYPAEQVERLRLIKRLMDQGHRPGGLLTRTLAELQALPSRRAAATAGAAAEPGDGSADLLTLIQRHEKEAYLQALQQRLAREGLQRFVQDTVAPLARRVGLAWEEGRLQVFEEHLFTELTERVLQQAVAAVPGGGAPRVLLTTVPHEQHAMGLLMVEAVLALEGAHCISLGTQMPLVEITRAAVAHRADIVALSFSGAFPARQIAGLLQQLRALLPPATGLWAGGAGVRRVAATDGVLVLHTLEEAVAGVAAWRAEQA